MVGLQELAARTPTLVLDGARLSSSILPASILGFVCVNIVTILVVLGLRYRHLLFSESYPSKASLSPSGVRIEALPEKQDDGIESVADAQLPELDITSPFPDLNNLSGSEEQRKQMARDKELYHALQNMESHPGAADRARARLVQLLDHTIHEAKADPSSSIISIEHYAPSALRQFFQTNHAANSYKYEAYIRRRRAGGPREMFPTYEYAVQWLKLAACVKYVDGGWVGNVLNMGLQAVKTAPDQNQQEARSSVPEREAAKMAWQVITEEFGDGDLAKNHVYLYYELIRSLDPSAQPGHVAGFDGLAPTDGPSRCWTAAIAQQCVGLMAGTDDFFPEALGFNMAYETLPYHLLVTSRELRELRIDDYYFALHITIDNPDSGHAALGRAAVETFLEGVRSRDGEEAMQAMWRRVQAGCVLADGLPTTPASPIEHERSAADGQWYSKTQSSSLISMPKQPASPIEREMMRLLTRKSLAAEKMHCSSRIRIEGHTVEEWLDPARWNDKRALEFLRALGRKRPWVIPGDKAQSRLVRELEWGGRMFGAFSAKETELVRQWIGQLGVVEKADTEQGAYERFVGRQVTKAGTIAALDLPCSRLVKNASQQLLEVSDTEITAILARLPAPSAERGNLESEPSDLTLHLSDNELEALWFTLPSLLEHFPLSPSKLATPLGMCALRILRSFSGFPDLHAAETVCAGMDHFSAGESAAEGSDEAEFAMAELRGWYEIGLGLFGKGEGNSAVTGHLQCVARHLPVNNIIADTCADLLGLRSRPYAHAELLLGITSAGVARLASVAMSRGMTEEDRALLARIEAEVKLAIKEFMGSADLDGVRDGVKSADFARGFGMTGALGV